MSTLLDLLCFALAGLVILAVAAVLFWPRKPRSSSPLARVIPFTPRSQRVPFTSRRSP